MKKRSPSITPADYSHSFNPYVFNAVNENSAVLDVGCWNGNLGKVLIEQKNCSVDGIDFEQRVLNLAEKNGYGKTYLVNLNKDPEKLNSIKKRYDVIVCADILEHIIDPESVLKLLKGLLTNNGEILISLPNVAFGLNRLNLLMGRWNYTEFGTLDKTHLRFFTAKTLKELVENAGLIVKEFKPYNQFGILSKLAPLDRIWSNFFCYQFLIIGSKR